MFNIEPTVFQIEYDSVKQALPVRQAYSHKHDHGHVLIIGAGKAEYGGSVCLAGEASMRAGAGLVSIIVAPESYVRSAIASVELMVTAYEEPNQAKSLFEQATVLLIGPGLSQNAWGEKWFHAVIESTLPKVIDADGLNWLAKFPQILSNVILTPHPGEAARLLNTTASIIQQDRVRSAKALQEKYGATVILKGAGTIVVDEQGAVHVMAGEFPALATAGTGDVLAGIISALWAQGMPIKEASLLAVSTHALASKEQAQQKGVRGMIASDLFPTIRTLLNPHSGYRE